MNMLEIPAKDASPYIKFDPKGTLEIKGKSFDEDVISLYEMVMNKIHEFGASDQDHLRVYIYLKYFNTASSKCLFDLLTAIKDLQEKNGKKIEMEWCYVKGDETMQEEIEEFREDTELDFKISPEKDYF